MPATPQEPPSRDSVTPTSTVIMGRLALSVGYDRYLKFVWPYLIAVFFVWYAFSGIAAAVG